MKFAGLYSMGSGNGRRLFTGTSILSVAPNNFVEINNIEGRFFTGQIQNLSADEDVVLLIMSIPSISQVAYTLHAREYIEFQNVPVSKIGVMVDGTVLLQGIGELWDLSDTKVSAFSSDFYALQNSYIKIGKISETSPAETPSWQTTATQSNPAQNDSLVSLTTPNVTNSKGYIYGVMMTAPETASLELNWTSGGAGKKKRFVIPASTGGTIWLEDTSVPINAGAPADPNTDVNIKVVLPAVPAGVYQADVLFSAEDDT